MLGCGMSVSRTGVSVMNYDYLIVGSGLFGAVFAREAADRGKKCLVLEKRGCAGGNVSCEMIEGICVHTYGPHIFHTDLPYVWDYVNRYVRFNRFTYSPLANYKGEIYNLPFNMNTFYRMWGTVTPEEAKKMIARQVQEAAVEHPANLEEQALHLVGRDIYEKLIQGYTRKQWGRDCKDLPAFIIRRIPVRFTYDNNYFNHPYQGIPEGGYHVLIQRLLEGITVKYDTDYLLDRKAWDACAEKTVYTGAIDAFFSYNEGHLAYRSLRFEHEVMDIPDFQGCAGVNYTDAETPWTRITEHKHFTYGTQAKTVITKEYPMECGPADEPYYPVNDEKNQRMYKKYREMAKREHRVIFGGRLGEYKYYDMDQVIAAALCLAEREFGVNR